MRVKIGKNKKGYCYVTDELHSAVLQYPSKPLSIQQPWKRVDPKSKQLNVCKNIKIFRNHELADLFTSGSHNQHSSNIFDLLDLQSFHK